MKLVLWKESKQAGHPTRHHPATMISSKGGERFGIDMKTSLLSADEAGATGAQKTAAIPLSQHPDDAAMIRAAAELTRDLSTARPEYYWPDFLACTLVGYAALAIKEYFRSHFVGVAPTDRRPPRS
jgi:hypothetical protein